MGGPTNHILTHGKFLICLFSSTGASFQELQKTGELPTSDHLFPLNPGLIYNTPSNHNPPHTGQRPPDFPKSIETHKPKHKCNTTHPSKAIHKPTNNYKTLDNESSGVHHKGPSTSEQNTTDQGKDLIIRNGRDVNPPKGLSDGRYPTSAPKRTTTCRTTKSTPRNTATTVRPVETTVRTLDKKSPTPREATIPSHSSVTSEMNKKTMVSSEKATKAMMPAYNTTRNEGKTTTAYEKATGAQVTPIEHGGQTTSAHEKTTGAHVTPTEHGGQTASSHEKATGAHVTPTEHGGQTASSHEKATGTTSAHEKATGAHVTLTEHGGQTTSAHEKVTGAHVTPTEHGGQTTSAHEKATGAHVTPTEHGGQTTSAHEKATGAHVTPMALISPTSGVRLSSILSEAPGNKSHSTQNNGGSQAGLHAGETGENGSFPPWAIVIVVLVAVILLLLFLGLIFLIFSVIRTRRALNQNMENDDPEENEGPNSYPVYLMEQQNLGISQIPSLP
uniref:Mucin like 3 n=1 Tax=Spermophilus dauricus TaxID=99837 RepID=A0A8C9Q810_SPEDA